MNKLPFISIITVTYNNKFGLINTIESVIEQTYKNIEYIVIDGESHDGSREVLQTYEENIAYMCSEPDEGIYDAMNKGLNKASGEWLHFLNSGDVYTSNKVLEDIFSHRLIKGDVLYGNTIQDYSSFIKYVYAQEANKLQYGMSFCHQSVFVKRDLMHNKLFNLKYKIAADFDFLLHAYLANKKFLKMELFVSKIDVQGVSNSKQAQCIKEQAVILWKNNFKKFSLRLFFLLPFFKVKECLSRFISNRLRQKYLFWKYKDVIRFKNIFL